jgi:hypothetical protein
MKAFADTREMDVERLVGALVDAALAVILQAGADEESVQIELDLWEALSGIHARERRSRRVAKLPVSNRIDLVLLARLTEAAFQVGLGHAVHGSSLDIALNILEAFQEIMEAHGTGAAPDKAPQQAHPRFALA